MQRRLQELLCGPLICIGHSFRVKKLLGQSCPPKKNVRDMDFFFLLVRVRQSICDHAFSSSSIKLGHHKHIEQGNPVDLYGHNPKLKLTFTSLTL